MDCASGAHAGLDVTGVPNGAVSVTRLADITDG